MDLAAFYAAIGRRHGRAAFEPAMMVALLLYALRARDTVLADDRGACEQTSPFRGSPPHQVRNHTTIARFASAIRIALAALFGEVLAVCRGREIHRTGLHRDI